MWVGISTACDIYWEVCKALCQIREKYVTRPKKWGRHASYHWCLWKQDWIPNDGTHIPIIAPSAYHNRKGWYSVLLQGLVDWKYKFLDFDVGWPGKCHDAFVLECSLLFQKLENGSFFLKITRKINRVDIPVLIVADSAHSLSKNVMKPFPEGRATASQRSFNELPSRARIHVCRADGGLWWKGMTRWQAT